MTRVLKKFTPEQRREYAKLMVHQGYSNKFVEELESELNREVQ